MQSHLYCRSTVVLIATWLCAGILSPLHAQMNATINSLADDSDAYPWDDPDTKEDEAQDGVCEDMAHRRTLRAALLEAANMGEGGVPCHVTINLSGGIVLTQGSLHPTAGSTLIGNLQTTIQGSSSDFSTMAITSNTTVRGLNFSGSSFILQVTGSGNTIAGNTFDGALDGIDVVGSGNTVGGSTPADRNIITHMFQSGIAIEGNNNVVKGNYIGINAQGDTVRNGFGVFSEGDNNIIGGTDPADRNIISGNRVSGIGVAGIPGVGLGTTIVGNYIGTDPTGTQERPNGYGVQVVSGHAAIGGVTPSERNVISGNTNGGVQTRGDALGVTIIGNYIGVDVTGTLPLGNGSGIDLSPGSFDCVVEKNVISHNGTGILISGVPNDPSWNHRIRGNKITHNTSFEGIAILGTATDIVVGSSLTQDFEPNEIQFNGTQGFYGFGVLINGNSTVGIPRANTIRKNDFQGNLTQGIGLEPNVQDGIQPPTIQNYVDQGNGQAAVTVTHHLPGSLIDVYVGTQTVSGQGYEGGHWLGSGIVAASNVPVTFPIDACNCDNIVATATDPAENTSQFYPFALTPLPITLVSFTGAVINGHNVRLTWTTLTEINNYGFEIQRSPGSENNYGTLPNSFTPGHGTTNEPHQYVFIDSSASPTHWYYRLRQIDLDGAVHYSDGIAINILTGVSETPLPDKFSLNQNYPNPFNPTTTIRFAIPVGAHGRASLRVFDVPGREVRTLVNEELQAGNYERTFDADGLASGIYFYTLTAGSFVQTKKLLLLR